MIELLIVFLGIPFGICFIIKRALPLILAGSKRDWADIISLSLIGVQLLLIPTFMTMNSVWLLNWGETFMLSLLCTSFMAILSMIDEAAWQRS